MTPEVITLDGLDRAGNLKKWQTLLRQSVSTACTFEIHCWEDEPDAMAQLENDLEDLRSRKAA